MDVNNIFKENTDTSSTIGFLLDVENDNNHTIKSYIPKYMCDINMSNKVWDKIQKLDYSCIKNTITNANNKIKTRNFIYLTPLQNIGKETTLPNIGESISVKFIDGDITKGRYYSLVTNNSYKNDYQRWFVESYDSYEDTKINKEYPKKWNTFKNITNSTITSEILNSNSITYDIDEDLAKESIYSKGIVKSTYDIILDSSKDISGFRILDINNDIITSITTKQKGQEINLYNKSDSQIKIQGNNIYLSNNNGILSLTNNISSIYLEDNTITLQTDSIKLILNDDIYVEKDGNIITLKEYILNN